MVRRRVIRIVAVSLFAASPSVSIAAGHVFMLRRVEGGVTLEKVALNEGEVKVWTSDAKSGVIDVIFPVGPGGSGSVARLSDGRRLVVAYRNGKLLVSDKMQDGKEFKRPERAAEDLARYDVRVSVTGADGTRQAFVIAQYKEFVRDEVGPVLDMFRRKIPLNEGDYVLFTNTYPHQAGATVHGEAPLEFDRWPFVKVKTADGKEGDFIVDIGAAGTVVDKSFVPAGVPIEKASMVQYSAGGKKLLKYTPGGATGQVESVVGQATLPEIRFGGLVFENATVDVMAKLPDFFGRPVAGIIGLDLLGRTERLSLSYPGKGRPAPMLRMTDRPAGNAGSAIELPFSIVKNHLMVKGEVNGLPVHFILDSGAPGCILDTDAAKAAGVTVDKSSARTARGMDGKGADILQAGPAVLKFGETTFSDVNLRVSKLFAFASMRTGGQHVGLLGNSFFQRFGRIDIDFGERTIRFLEKTD